MHLDVAVDPDAERARSLLLGSLWRDAIDLWRDIDTIRKIPAACRLLDAGADPGDLSVALRAASLEAAFAVLARVDAGRSSNGWCLVRTEADGSATTRPLGELHPELLALDPSGASGVDLRR